MHIRPAVAADQPTIHQIVRAAHLNPFDLDWRRFVVAEDKGAIVGVGQVKPHRDGNRELASIAVIPGRQRQGIGSEIIRALLAQEKGAVYLFCRQRLESYYARFGFRRIGPAEMTPFFRRMIRAASLFAWLRRGGVQVIVMKRVSR